MKGEHDLAIRMFDYGAAALFGAACAVAAAALVPDGLAGLPAMALGMAIGLVAAVPLLGLLSCILGGFEIVVLAMQVGMAAGMAGAMAGRAGASAAEAIGLGVVVGLAIQVGLHAWDRALHGEVREGADR